MYKQVLVPVANGCEETEVVILVDILRRAKVDVVVASVEKSTKIVASQQTKIIADKSIEEASDSPYDLVLLPVRYIICTAYTATAFLLIDDYNLILVIHAILCKLVTWFSHLSLKEHRNVIFNYASLCTWKYKSIYVILVY